MLHLLHLVYLHIKGYKVYTRRMIQDDLNGPEELYLK